MLQLSRVIYSQSLLLMCVQLHHFRLTQQYSQIQTLNIQLDQLRILKCYQSTRYQVMLTWSHMAVQQSSLALKIKLQVIHQTQMFSPTMILLFSLRLRTLTCRMVGIIMQSDLGLIQKDIQVLVTWTSECILPIHVKLIPWTSV